MQVETLKKNYQGNEAVKAICDHMATRTNNQNESFLHRIVLYLRQEGWEFNRSEIIAALRLLEQSECGRYVEGRHGWKSRFVWSVSSKLVSGVAQGTVTKADLIVEASSDDELVENELIEHVYVLRPDVTISIELPADLSRNEAQRLSQFIDTLSFEE